MNTRRVRGMGVVLLTLLNVAASAQQASPPIHEWKQAQGNATDVYQVPEGVVPIKAVVVRSWNDGGQSATSWRELNTEWPRYGSRAIAIDTTTLLTIGRFTYADLVNSGADVIILSDPAGGVTQYRTEEINAIAQYAAEGHNLIGTYLVFWWLGIDNRGLAPAFGLRPDLAYDSYDISNRFNITSPDECLFAGIPAPSWTSSGYPLTQSPTATQKWNEDALAGAMVVADSDNRKAIASIYDGGTYRAIYISNMPEYFGGTVDKQLLYNAITCYVK